MPITVTKFAGATPETIFVDSNPQDSGQGPYVPWSSVTDLGEELIRAPNAATARQALGITGQALFGGTVRPISANGNVLGDDGILLANAAGGAFVITMARDIGDPKALMVLKVGTDTNPVTIQDDSGGPNAVKMVLLAGGQAIAVLVASGGVVYANGVM
jgi:hypothetical protein